MGPIASGNAAVQGAVLHGVVDGGRQPIAGARVYLLEATTTGYGQASKSLLTTGDGTDSIGTYVLTNSVGFWTINGDYTCDANAQSYLYALGGDTGAGANSAVALLAVLGQCPSSSPFTYAAADPFVTMNEVTTVAAAYAMAGYATDATHVSSSNTALAATGLANAFANAGNLVTLSTGVANTNIPSNSSGVAPQAEINTLGNILAACVNSNGSSSFECSTLLANAQLNGSTGGQPTDVASAAINIAHNPASGITALYGLQPAISAPFVPDLTSQPTDFTVGITFNGNGITAPKTVAIDGTGNVWVTGVFGLSVFTANGGVYGNSPFSGNGLASSPQAIAIDSAGNAWTAGYQDNSISEFTASGDPATGSPFIASNGINFPDAMAIDGPGNVWVSNCNTELCDSNIGGVSKYTSGGGVSGSSPFGGNGLSGPTGIAFDTAGNAWVADSVTSGVSKFTNSGGTVSGSPFTAGGMNGPAGIALDGSGNVWVTDSNTNALTALTSNGTAKGSSPFTGGGLHSPLAIAIDGSGNVWATNRNGTYVSEFSNSGAALCPATGLGSASFSSPGDYANSIAIDGSGNVWTLDTTNGLLIELVGAATPVVTPIVANLQPPYGAHAVNLP